MRRWLIILLLLVCLPAAAQELGNGKFKCLLLGGGTDGTDSQCLLVSGDLIYEDEDCDCVLDSGVDFPITSITEICAGGRVTYAGATAGHVTCDPSFVFDETLNKITVQDEADATPGLSYWCDNTTDECTLRVDNAAGEDTCFDGTTALDMTADGLEIEVQGQLHISTCHQAAGCTCEAATDALMVIDSGIQIGDGSGNHDHNITTWGKVVSKGGVFENNSASAPFAWDMTNASHNGVSYFRFKDEGTQFFNMDVNEQGGTCDDTTTLFPTITFCDSDSDCQGIGLTPETCDLGGKNYTQIWKTSNTSNAPAYIFNTVSNMDDDAIVFQWQDQGSPLLTLDALGDLKAAGAYNVVVEGSTADGNELTIVHTDPTADNTITFPDDSGLLMLRNAWNGTFREHFNALVTSDGATVTLSLEQAGGGDLTMRFSDGDTALDCTPACTIALTAGSDTSPGESFVYILQSGKVLAESTSDWPATEHIKVSYNLVPSATFVNTANRGVYVNQNWNDGDTESTSQGHFAAMAERSRRDGAYYHSGVTGNGSDDWIDIVGASSPDDVYFKSVAGVLYQMHKHTFPAKDTSGTDTILIVNDSVTPYKDVANLNLELTDSLGVTMSNKYFNLTFMGVANKGGEYGPLLMNLPSCSYASLSGALNDTSGCDVTTIPAAFNTESSTGFLITKVTFKHAPASSGTWVVHRSLNLLGADPVSAAGGGASASQTDFADNAFTIFDESDTTKVIAFQASGITTGTTRTLTAQDASGTIAYTTDPGSAIDSDTDGTNEVAMDLTNSAIDYDYDDDGQIDRMDYKDMDCDYVGFMGDSSILDWTTRGTVAHQDDSTGKWGNGKCTTGATSGNDCDLGFAMNGQTTTAIIDPTKMRMLEVDIAIRAGDSRAYVGMFSTATDDNFLTVDMGAYFLCGQGDDVDGNATPGDTNDEKWWAVVQDGDADHSGDICATLTGVQCATYTATNTEAWNTEVSCITGAADWHRLRIEQEPGAGTVRFYVDDTLEWTTTSGSIPDGTTDLWTGLSIVMETNEAVAQHARTDFLRACHAD